MNVEQDVLFEDLELSANRRRVPVPTGDLKLRVPNRDQLARGLIDLKVLIPGDHKVRAIWDLTGQLDLSSFRTGLRTQKGETGRAAWDPRLLVSIWIYALSEGINSARAIEKMMAYEPGLMWLSGREVVNHHTLSDLRK